ncbi:hypothetical protein [Ekhidna sp.]|jgi:hypothetical protein|uniref:hypothetical protein n=1 Tax=Ekhidna sp. TaxID=2608089 RepID=UPI0032EE4F59
MKHHQKLDLTLSYLKELNDPYGEESHTIHEELNLANDALEQHLILEKLVADGYVDVLIPKDQKTGEQFRNNPNYVINYNGIVFMEQNGYQSEFAIRNRERINRIIVSWLNPAWKVVAFIAAILGLLKLLQSLFTP